MKLNRLETHDRLIHLFKDQSANVVQGASDCLKKNPLSLALQEKCPYIYVFGHVRTHDNGIDKVLYWQPRLHKPLMEPNSYLFRAESKTDVLEVCWLLPQQEMWKQYKKGNVTEHETVIWSIDKYLTSRQTLEEPHPQDLSEESAKNIMRQVIDEHRQALRMKNNQFIKI